MEDALGEQNLGRYRRQIALVGFGREGQEKLTRAHVAVIGAGGLGSPVIAYLAGAGVGRITIVDDDDVELSNLHRQVIHATGWVGENKARSAVARVAELNPGVTGCAVAERLGVDNALGILGGADLVIDGSDNFATRHLVSWAAARLGVPHVWGAILGFQAQVSVFSSEHGPVYEDLYPAPPAPGAVPSCADNGVLGPVVGQAGTLMAMEALKLLAGIGKPLIGTLAYLDTLAARAEYVPVTGAPGTAAEVRAGRFLVPDPQAREVDEVPEGAALLDVREDFEFEAYHLPGAVHVPLGEILAGGTPQFGEDRPCVVVYCAAGVRSARAIQALEARGVTGLRNLRGGINGWLSRHGGAAGA